MISLSYHRGRLFSVLFWLCFILEILGIILYSPPTEAGYHITIQPILVIREEVTDNVFLAKDARQYDFITFIAPGFEAVARSPSSDINFKYQIGYSDYNKFPENNAWRHNAQLAGMMDLTKATQLQFSNNLLITEESTDELSDEYLMGEETPVSPEERIVEKEVARRIRDRYLTNASRIRLFHRLSETDTVALNYEYRVRNSEDPTVRNRKRHRPALEMTYWIIPEEWGLESEIRYTRDDVSDSVEEPGFFEENINPALTMRYWLIPKQLELRTAMSYELGVINDEEDYRELQGQPDNWYESIKPSVGILYWSPRTRISMESEIFYRKGITYSDDDLSDPSDDFEIWSGTIEMGKRFNRRWKGILGFTYTQTDFLGTDIRNGEEEDYKLYIPSLGFEYWIAEDIPMALTAGYLIRDMEFSDQETAIILNGSVGPWRFSKYGTIRFKASSGYDESFLDAERLGFGVYKTAEFDVDYSFTPDLAGRAYGLYEKYDYVDFEDRRDDRTLEMGSALIYRLTEWLSIRCGYRYRKVNSTDDEDSYRENRMFLETVFTPLRPIEMN